MPGVSHNTLTNGDPAEPRNGLANLEAPTATSSIWLLAEATYGHEPVGCANSVSRGEAVFVDESAEAVATLDIGR